MAASLFKKVIGAALLSAIATVLTGCYTYEVKMSYKCTQPPVAPNTQCMAWEQVGGVQTPTTCFPGSATVTTRNGPKAMSQLKIGEEILGFDHASGKAVFSEVRAWLHREVNIETEMSAVHTKDGVLIVSPRHNLAINGGSEYEFAGELQVGATLLSDDGKRVTVTSPGHGITGEGLYAPLTWSSNFFVSGPELKTSILAHSFAELRHPLWFDGVLHKFLSALELFTRDLNVLTDEDAYIHPVARFFGYGTVKKTNRVIV